MFDAMLAHTYNKDGLRRAVRMIKVVVALSFLLLVYNGFTGVCFYIDANGLYHRGRLFWIFYAMVVFQVVYLLAYYIKNRSSVGHNVVSVMQLLPILTVVLCALRLLYPLLQINGTIAAFACLVIDISFLSHSEEMDNLTGAGSRKAFVDELTMRSENDQSVQLIQFSILNLVDANLRWGQETGDAILYEVARYFQSDPLPAQIFRTANMTFTLILPLEDAETAESRLQQIRKRLLRYWTLGEVRFQLEIAIAELRSGNLTGTPDEIIEQLNYTLEAAKKQPPLARFDNAVQERLAQRNRMLALIQKSIEERRFYVAYQPLYYCRRDTFSSAEALLRLRDEDGSAISPGGFIPLAEEHGMITELTRIVLEDVCKLLADGQFPGLESVSVNLSMQQLLDPDAAVHIKEILDRYQVQPEKLKLEITERFILHDAQYAKEQVGALRDLGFQISMDDFGTGYSNLSSILHFPFTDIKLDRSLIAGVAENDQAATMVRSLTRMFQDLGKSVVAEGVETKEQADHLKEVGVDMIQGFYYARPAERDSLSPYFGAKEVEILP